jgi:hypothetical protein
LLAWMDEVIELFFLRGQGRLAKPEAAHRESPQSSKPTGRETSASNGHRSGDKTAENGHSRPDRARRN